MDRVGSTGFVQLEAESFKTLPLKEQTLAYWLTQAAIAIDPINYDQNSPGACGRSACWKRSCGIRRA